MFRNTPLASTPTIKLILGLGLCTLGGAMLYVYYKNRDEDDESQNDTQQQVKKNAHKATQKEKKVTIKLEISNDHIPLIVGRGGTNLVLIEEKTRTTIRFRDKSETHKFCDISGSPEAVKEARALLLKEIDRSPSVKEEIYVPASVCGKIVGRCGEAMQEICRLSLAKVSVDSGGRNGGMDKRRITITGNRQQVNIARKLIEDKIQEDEDVRREVEEVEQHREPRRSPTNSISSSMYSSQNSLNSHLPPREKLLASNTEEKPMEVYVSAIASPSKFWVQLIGPQSKKLDVMVQTMTNYYGEAVNREMHKIAEPYLGQIVAAVFKYDGKWYRAEIVGILPNQYNPNEVVLDLYFVDYGDSEYVAPHEVFELRTDFLTLRFQAVECFLANIKSIPPNDSDSWDPQSIQKFEELTQVANWKKLISRVVAYKERLKQTNDNVAITERNANSRESSPVPGVELYDLTEGVEVNIGHMLISHGFALSAEDNQPRSSNYASIHPQSPFARSNESLTDASTHCQQQQEQHGSSEDALIEQQLENLQRKHNLVLNGNDRFGGFNPPKPKPPALSAEDNQPRSSNYASIYPESPFARSNESLTDASTHCQQQQEQHVSSEDALIEQPIEPLQRKHNLVLNGNDRFGGFNPPKFIPTQPPIRPFNQNFINDPNTPTTNGTGQHNDNLMWNTNLNGNLSR